MGKNFNPTDFARRAPAALLRQYCENQGILEGFWCGSGKNIDAEAFIQAVHDEQPEGSENEKKGLFRRVTAHFHSVDELAGKGFTLGLLNEAEHVGDFEAVTALKAQRSHLAKAFWATLNRPQLIPNASILAEVDALPSGAWLKRKSLPIRGLPVDDIAVQDLQDALITFFTRRERRGENCKIDCLRRGNEEIFFAYAEDHPQTDVFWQQGSLTQQTLSPSFKLIFKHRDKAGTLDIYTEGDRNLVPDLQQIFAKTVIGDDVPRYPPPDDIVYDLSRLLEPGFQFEHSPDLGIRDVRVTKMRFRIKGLPWRRFLVEANTGKHPDALADMVSRLTAEFETDELDLDQVWIKVLFLRRGNDVRDRSPSFCITAPNSLRVQQNEFGDRINEMLRQSGIETAPPDNE
ncbi:MAG: hypothetical protein AB7U75_20790 [Hyphomicrobiaceae bacterium]